MSLTSARETLDLAIAAIESLKSRLGVDFERAVELILQCKGRLVVTGLGKSGKIADKIAATLASTGTPALFLHSAEGLHGDLGMVTEGDVMLAFSYSGRTEELINSLGIIKDMKVPIIAVTGNPSSLLAMNADAVLDVSVEREACPLNLAPTTSTIAEHAMGDALALAVMRAREFTREDFARFHPGGSLGKQVRTKVEDLMRSDNRLAKVGVDALVHDVLFAITRAQAGAAVVVDAEGKLAGLVTDGDVRRHLIRDGVTVLEQTVTQIMTRTPVTTTPNRLAVEALRLMQERVIDDLPVVNEDGKAVGMLDVQELLRAGLL